MRNDDEGRFNESVADETKSFETNDEEIFVVVVGFVVVGIDGGSLEKIKI